MDLEKLKARREKLRAKLSALDAQIARAERAAREAEQRELIKLIKSRGLTAAQLAAMLDAGAGARNEQNDKDAVHPA